MDKTMLDCSALAPWCLGRASASFQEPRGKILKLSIVLPCKNAVNFAGMAAVIFEPYWIARPLLPAA